MAKITKPGGAKAAAAPKSKYAGVSGTKMTRDANYYSAGRYLALIEKVEEGENNSGALIVAIQHIVLSADDSTRAGLDEKTGPIKRVGESVTDLHTKNNVAFAANLMAFAVTVSGMDQETIQANEEYDGAFIEEIVGEDQPFAGRVVEVNVKVVPNKEAKKSGKPLDSFKMGEGLFTKVSCIRAVPFAELSELVEESILARFIPDLDEKIAQEAAEDEESAEG